MGFVRMEEGVGTPPQALFEAMDEYISERAAKGVFLDGGGLYGTEDAVNYVVRQGEVIGAGDRLGLIRFGSRVDIYLPSAARTLVTTGSRSIAGETVLAELHTSEPRRNFKSG